MKHDRDEILSYHLGGKVGLRLTKSVSSLNDLCLAYTPGVAVPVSEIAGEPGLADSYTARSNLVAVVSDGTAVLGMGDVGATASIPVLEGKAMLFKAFGDVDGWPVPLNNCRKGGANEGKTEPARVIDAVCAIAPMYGGINLEDIAAPACFEIEDRLDELLDIPVFHDDQWGTAVITLAGVMNYALLSDRGMDQLNVVINGAGAAGIRIAQMLKAAGAGAVTLCDSKGVVSESRTDISGKKREHAVATKARTVSEAMKGANVFVGVSVADCISRDDILGMDSYPAIFAMSNPDPEIRPEAVAECMKGRPYVMATGRSDYPNQVNNVLGFPFLFRGALDARAQTITIEMKTAAARALADLARQPAPKEVSELYPGETLEFGNGYVIPKPFDRRLLESVSFAVADAAVRSGAAPRMDMEEYRLKLRSRNESRASL